MKPMLRPVLILLLLLTLWGCPPKPPVRVAPPPKAVETGETLFKQAENLFQQKAYDEALSRYKAYLSKFPAGPLVDTAFIRMGTIYERLEDFPAARSVYQKLRSEYPQSRFAADAGVALLEIAYRQKEYDRLIQEGNALLRELVSRPHILRTYILLAQAYTARENPRHAVLAYGMALNIASEDEKKPILTAFKKGLKRNSMADIEALLQQLKDPTAISYLRYQLGLLKTGVGQYEAAFDLFSEFLKDYPQHEYAGIVSDLIQELNNKLAYDHNAIGCLLPLSGRFAAFGERALQGIELAFHQFNTRPGHPALKIRVRDSAASSETTARAVDGLADQKVAAILGPMVTAETAAKAAQTLDIPIIIMTQKDQITELGDYVFRNFITPQMQAKTLATYAVEEMGLKRFAILYPQEPYGTTFINLFWDEVVIHQGQVVGAEAYNPKSTDFADPINKIVGLYYPIPSDVKQSDQLHNIHLYDHDEEEPGDTEVNEDVYFGPESKAIIDFAAIFIPDAPQKVGLILPQLAYYDIEDVVLLGTNLWHSPRLINMARDYVQGAVMTEGFFAESSLPQVHDFVTRFEALYDHKPEFIEAIFYDSAMILFEALSKPDIRFRSQIRDELKKLTDFHGVTGRTAFTESGDVSKNLYLLRVKGDHFIEAGQN